jgi:carboxymethylenebutenolidase
MRNKGVTLALPSQASAFQVSRRAFVQAAIAGSGFAAAVLPVAAQTIQTPSDGLLAGPIAIPVGSFAMPAYRAQPATAKDSLPVVIVVSEIFGLHEHIADVARRFAQQGYLAIAPELFVRQGDAKAYTEVGKLISEVIAKVPDEQVMGDLDAVVAWAKAQGADVGRLGVTGFCWGGRITWMYCAHNPAVSAGVAWYGRLVGAATPNTPRHPIDAAGQLQAPVLGLYGAADPGISLDSIDKMKSALAAGSAAARRSEFLVFPDGPHAFHADYRPSYRKEMAEEGWRRCLAWFKTHGVS